MPRPRFESSREQIAHAYNALVDKGYFTDRFGGNERYLGRLMLHHIPAKAHSILEIGGATGLWMHQVLRRRPAMREVTIVEISAAAETCRDRLSRTLHDRPGSRLDVIRADFLDVKDELPQAQVVASSFVAEYMGDPATYVRALYDLAEPGGRVVFIDVLTRPDSPAGSIGPRPVLASFARLCLAYVKAGRIPPLIGVARALPLYRFPSEPAFQALYEDYTATYDFPRAAWIATQREYPGAEFLDLGMAGLLMVPKPE
ncbi:class I SAM-dependent methyltransferase [Actinobacteria bacterium YIM 96077]|uniref:Class I SAM-dependent methyltransferase n=1 Tax=Phytoactinopolyspora halophila TaxID=1981511 RepID=A0A329QYR2_9ACTN|nr:class I SAM-dependent methyltransferase [Phytoactinopolyspora halophila]AYY13364.1 class I SAM-dependent methyltransferase [Actinobacteria bacterium YIM 96077]RAW17401.1 hypothetical protein DPM12_05095 [Phytoactinopolyspora halophila]